MIAFENSPFLIGVTGHMDLRPEEVDPLKERVRALFRFLRCDERNRQREQLETLLDLMRAPQPSTELERVAQETLRNWPLLKNTPLVVFSSLAPGADTLVAEVVLEEEFQAADFTLIGALPFPRDVYREASTFVRKKTVSEDQQRQQVYDRLLAAMDRQPHVQTDSDFPVYLTGDNPFSHAEVLARFAADRNAQNPTNRRRRYLAAGEYMAAYSHLLIAIWDSFHDKDTSAGAARIIDARRRGMSPGLLATTSALTLPHGGPILHLSTHRAENPATASADVAPVRWLHPYGSAPPEAVTEEGDYDDDHANWQRTSLVLFCRIAQNVSDFNQVAQPDSKKVDSELTKRLVYTEPADDKKHGESFSPELEQLLPEKHAALRLNTAPKSLRARNCPPRFANCKSSCNNFANTFSGLRATF